MSKGTKVDFHKADRMFKTPEEVGTARDGDGNVGRGRGETREEARQAALADLAHEQRKKNG